MIVQLKNISKQYKDAKFKLQNISFDINKKEVIGIIGRNGTGKSTILKMINGIVNYDSGDILYKSQSLSEMTPATLRQTRKNLAYIFQHSNLIDNKSVYYHLSLVYKLNKVPVVLLGQEGEYTYSVEYNDFNAARDLANFVLASGHRKIAYLGVGEEDIAVGYYRKLGFMTTLEKYNLSPVDVLITNFGMEYR